MIFNMTSGKMKTPVLSSGYPADAAVNAGTSAAFRVAISEDGLPREYTYQWYVNGSPVSGATGSSYTRDTSGDKGVYSVYCAVTNKAGTVTSRAAALTVRKTPTLSGSYPADATVTKGGSVTCQVYIASDGYPASYTYQWYVNGSPVSGANSSSYTFSSTWIADQSVYCAVTNAAGTVNSRVATVRVTALYLPISDGTWSAYGWQGTADSEYWGNRAPTITYGAYSTAVSLSCEFYGTGGIAIYGGGMVDLTPYDTLHVTWDWTIVNALAALVIFNGNESAYWFDNAVARLQIPNESSSGGFTTQTLDVSSISGYWHIGLGIHGWGETTNIIDAAQIYLE